MKETMLGTSGICRKDALRSLLPITMLAPPGLQAAGRVADAAGVTMVAGETALSCGVWPGSWCPLAQHRARGPSGAQGPHYKPTLHTPKAGRRGGDLKPFVLGPEKE